MLIYIYGRAGTDGQRDSDSESRCAGATRFASPQVSTCGRDKSKGGETAEASSCRARVALCHPRGLAPAGAGVDRVGAKLLLDAHQLVVPVQGEQGGNGASGVKDKVNMYIGICMYVYM